MHHCHRNLLGFGVDANVEADAFAGGDAAFEFMLRNESALDRCDIEIRLHAPRPRRSRPWARNGYEQVTVNVPVARARGCPMEPVRAAHALSVRLVSRLDLCASARSRPIVAPQPRGDRPLPSAAAAAGSAARSEARGDEDFAGLRAYAPGVPLKHMAWKVLARGGEAAVRSYTDLAAQPEWLEWSALEGLETEARLSQLCRWVLASEAGHRRPYGLRIPGVEIAPGRGGLHRARCLRALATYATEAPR